MSKKQELEIGGVVELLGKKYTVKRIKADGKVVLVPKVVKAAKKAKKKAPAKKSNKKSKKSGAKK